MPRYLVRGIVLLIAGCGATAPQERILGTWVGTTSTNGDSAQTSVQFVFLDGGDLITQEGTQRTIGSYRVFQADREGLAMKVWVSDAQNEELAIYDTLVIEKPEGDIVLRRKHRNVLNYSYTTTATPGASYWNVPHRAPLSLAGHGYDAGSPGSEGGVYRAFWKDTPG